MNTSMITNSQRNFGLDLLRAIAVLLVVFSHYFASTPLRVGGVIGVEMFFVLSGYLIGSILYRFTLLSDIRVNDLYTFWVRRWVRTLPNYLFFLLVFTALAYPWYELDVSEWLKYLFFLQNLAEPLNGFYGLSWSLSI